MFAIKKLMPKAKLGFIIIFEFILKTLYHMPTLLKAPHLAEERVWQPRIAGLPSGPRASWILRPVDK